ncbi:MAG: hypothetical protein M8364_02095 [Methylobacter sp.]|uniref:hypothetical protein n=1 Tax=Methylobacter sp. TaxID=2051955 RepID=UPI00258CEE43|nr:hypothetical protein [Methylobacter sp.]MCL7419684.1 hypothetical protein [Methylobacter sp.]
MIKTAFTAARLFLIKRPTRRVLLWSAFLYGLLYLLAIGDLDFHSFSSNMALTWSGQPLDLLFKSRAPFYFEAIAVVEFFFLTYLFSPLNLLLAVTLALLVGLNVTTSYIGFVQPKVCRGRPAAGLLTSLPALLAGSACCGPLLLVLLGIQATAALVAFFSLLVPVSILLLLGAWLLSLRQIDIEYLRQL